MMVCDHYEVSFLKMFHFLWTFAASSRMRAVCESVCGPLRESSGLVPPVSRN